METCLYNGKQISAYKVLNSNLALDYDLEKEWKAAGRSGTLICEDCGSVVQLRVYDPKRKVPHFFHKGSKCPYSNETTKESEEHKRGELILYNYFMESYPDANVMLNHRFPSRRKADLFIEFYDGSKLAIEYQRTDLDFSDWEERHNEYVNANIKVLWILNGKEEILQLKEKQVDVTFFHHVMLNELDKVAVYLDVDKSKMILIKNMRYKDSFLENNDFEELYVRSYELKDTIIHTDGHIQCDFTEKYNAAYDEFKKRYAEKCLNDEENRKKKREEELQWQKFIEEQKAKQQPKIQELIRKPVVNNKRITQVNHNSSKEANVQKREMLRRKKFESLIEKDKSGSINQSEKELLETYLKYFGN